MWLVVINYKQQIHRVMKFLIWNINWKSQFVSIIIYINANIVLPFNLAKIFFSHRKFNPNIIKIISKLSVILCNSFEKHFWSLFLRLISPFFGLLIQQVILCKNFLIMVYKLSVHVLRLNWFNNPARSYINPVINSAHNFLKRVFETKFMIYHCFCCWIEVKQSKFDVSI